MAALTVASGYPIRESFGSLTFYIFRFSSVADADTFASGLGANVVAFWLTLRDNPATQASAGAAATYSATTSGGTFTLYPGEDSLINELYVLART